MQTLKLLLIGLAVVTVSYAQTRSGNSLSQKDEVVGIETFEITEPDASESVTGADNEKTLAALAAVKEGNELWREGNAELSAASYRRAINLQPALYSAQFNLGTTLLRTKQFPAAEVAFKESAALDPESAEAWLGLGFARYYQRQFQVAAEAFAQAQRLAPFEPAVSNNLGFANLLDDRLEEAAGSFLNALKLDHQFAPAKNGLCSTYSLAKKSAQAVTTCLEAVRSSADSAVPLYFLGFAYLDLGRHQEALSAFEEAARLEPSAKIYVGLALAHYRLMKYREALENFQHARQLDSKVVDALPGIGATYAQLGDFRKAEKALREALHDKPDSPTIRFNLGLVCLRRKDRDCALSQYNYLKMMDHSLASKLFTRIFGDRVIDAGLYKDKF